MPSKRKKYNARFPPARIKKIMQSDEEVGKVAQAVPVIISRALELFVESLLKKAETVTQARNAKTLTPSHMKQCIMSEGRFDFLKDLVAAVPDVQGEEDLAETPATPRSSASNQAFLYPTVPAGTSNLRTSGSVPSSALGAPVYEESDSDDQDNDEQEQPYEHPKIAEYAQDLPPFPSQSIQKSVIVSQQQHQQQSGYIMNPASVTSNPYIPNISSGSSHPGMGGLYMYPHPHPHLQNPNGTNPSQQSPSTGVIVYEDKTALSHHHHYQKH